MTQYVLLITIFVIVFTNLGCSSNERMERVPVYPAKLKLLYQGRPAKGAYVVLRPIDGVSQAHPPAYGEADVEGIVKFTTYEAYDGAAIGNYIITATWTEIDDDENQSPDRFRGKYSSPEKSKLRCVIEKGDNDLGVINIE